MSGLWSKVSGPLLTHCGTCSVQLRFKGANTSDPVDRNGAKPVGSLALLGACLALGQVGCATELMGVSPVGHWELAGNPFRTPAIVWIEPYPHSDLLSLDAQIGCTQSHRAVRATNGHLEDAPEPFTDTVVEGVIEAPCYAEDRTSAAAGTYYRHAWAVLDGPAIFEVSADRLVLRNAENGKIILRHSSGSRHPLGVGLE